MFFSQFLFPNRPSIPSINDYAKNRYHQDFRYHNVSCFVCIYLYHFWVYLFRFGGLMLEIYYNSKYLLKDNWNILNKYNLNKSKEKVKGVFSNLSNIYDRAFRKIAGKMSVSGVFLIRISPYSDLIRRDTEYSLNSGKHGQEKRQIQALFRLYYFVKSFTINV